MGACGEGNDTGAKGVALDFAPDETATKGRFDEAGQSHVFNGFDDLDENAKQDLLSQCC